MKTEQGADLAVLARSLYHTDKRLEQRPVIVSSEIKLHYYQIAQLSKNIL